jgi:hypothetical protein
MRIDGQNMAPPKGSVWEDMIPDETIFVVEGVIRHDRFEGNTLSVDIDGGINCEIGANWLMSIHNPCFLCTGVKVNVPLHFKNYFEYNGKGYIRCYPEHPTFLDLELNTPKEFNCTISIPADIEIKRILCDGALQAESDEIRKNPPSRDKVEWERKQAVPKIISKIAHEIEHDRRLGRKSYWFPSYYKSILGEDGISKLIERLEPTKIECGTDVSACNRVFVFTVKICDEEDVQEDIPSGEDSWIWQTIDWICKKIHIA